MNFKAFFLLQKSGKGGRLTAGDDVASGPRWADVERGTTAPLRRGTKATW